LMPLPLMTTALMRRRHQNANLKPYEGNKHAHNHSDSSR